MSRLLTLLSVVCFVCAAIGVPHLTTYSLQALGLAFWASASLVGSGS